jgi:isopenicillin N synthase-like dioxygenase
MPHYAYTGMYIVAAAARVPVVDMQALLDTSADGRARREAIATIDKACRQWGFFQVLNHGISERLLAECASSSRIRLCVCCMS